MLTLLLEKQGAVLARDEILDRAWAQDEFPTPRTVDNFIVRLRRLIEADPGEPRVIRSVRGVGYQLDVAGRAGRGIMSNLFQRALARENDAAASGVVHAPGRPLSQPLPQAARRSTRSSICARARGRDPGHAGAHRAISISMPRSCSRICSSRSRRWACRWTTSPARRSAGTCASSSRPRSGCRTANERSPGARLPGSRAAPDPRAAARNPRVCSGFVGGPLTLFFYAAAGSHQGDLAIAHAGLTDGRYAGFCAAS